MFFTMKVHIAFGLAALGLKSIRHEIIMVGVFVSIIIYSTFKTSFQPYLFNKESFFSPKRQIWWQCVSSIPLFWHKQLGDKIIWPLKREAYYYSYCSLICSEATFTKALLSS